MGLFIVPSGVVHAGNIVNEATTHLEVANLVSQCGRATTGFVFVVGSLGEEDGAEIAIAEAIDGELTVIDGG
jgi:hypothetical protein